MAIALVQSNNFGTPFGSFGSPIQSQASYAANTAAGNLLICIVSACEGTNSSPVTPTLSAPSTPGFTWTLAATETGTQYTYGATIQQSVVAVYYIENALSMASSVVTTCATNLLGNSGNVLDFDLVEFSGAALSGVVDVTAIAIGVTNYPSGVVPPSAGTLTTSVTDLVLVVGGSALPGEAPGSGYTELDAAGFGGEEICEAQYILNAGAGAYATAFGLVTGSSASSIDWACVAVAFKASGAPVVTVTNVNPNNGPIAGGTPVTITGTTFLSGATVDFGGSSPTSIVVVNSTTITCVTPAHSYGYVTVSVTDSDGTGSLSNGYTYTNYVPILVVSPSTLSYGAVFGGANPAAQNVSVSNGNGGTLSWTLSSDEAWLTATPTSGINSSTVSASVSITGLAIGTYTGHLTFAASGATGSPQIVTVTLVIAPSGGGGGSNTFTPMWPPIKKQPITLWGLEAKRADSITADGQKQSVLDHIDEVTTLTFPFVPASDMAAWKALESYALTGGEFTYRPLIDYPNFTSTDPMFQYPGTSNGDNATGFSVCECLSMEWKPKFESFGNFSLEMKLKLVEDM